MARFLEQLLSFAYREVLRGAPLRGESGLEAFPAIEAGLVSTEAYPH